LKNVIQIRGTLVHSHAILDEDGVTLIDCGFLGNAAGRIETALQAEGRSLSDVSRIIITHGHIDHTLQVAHLKKITGAKVYAPLLDEAHILGKYPYRGISRICDGLEKLTCLLFRYQSPEVDHWFQNGNELHVAGGLHVIGLPGHTMGHCGFYWEKEKILFAADLFSNFRGRVTLPPPWFNVDQEMVKISLQKANELDLSGGILLNHCRPGTPEEHRRDLAFLAKKHSQ